MPDDIQQQVKIALLLNAGVFPGAGYFLIGQRLKGIIVVGTTLILFALALTAFLKGFRLGLLTLHATAPIFPQITRALQLGWVSSSHQILAASLSIISLWVYGIVDLLKMKGRSSPRQ